MTDNSINYSETQNLTHNNIIIILIFLEARIKINYQIYLLMNLINDTVSKLFQLLKFLYSRSLGSVVFNRLHTMNRGTIVW